MQYDIICYCLELERNYSIRKLCEFNCSQSMKRNIFLYNNYHKFFAQFIYYNWAYVSYLYPIKRGYPFDISKFSLLFLQFRR